MITVAPPPVESVQTKKPAGLLPVVLPMVALFVAGCLTFHFIPETALDSGDYQVHMKVTQLVWHSSAVTPHPLFQWLCIALQSALPMLSLGFVSERLVPFTCIQALNFSVYFYFLKVTAAPSSARWRWLYALAAIIVGAFGPINFLVDSYRFRGYIPTNVYHNPTVLLVKPMVVWLFYLVAEVMQRSKIGWKLILQTAFVEILNLVAKPSWVLCMVPIVMLWSTKLMIARNWQKLMRVWTAIAMPCLILLVQYYIIYISRTGSESSSIVFNFCGPMSFLSKHLELKLLLSLLAPLCITLFFLKQARHDQRLMLSWAVLGVAIAQTYLLAETGARYYHLNFLWGSELALFTVSMASISFLCELWKTKKLHGAFATAQTALCCAFISMHVIGGVLLNFLNTNSKTRLY